MHLVPPLFSQWPMRGTLTTLAIMHRTPSLSPAHVSPHLEPLHLPQQAAAVFLAAQPQYLAILQKCLLPMIEDHPSSNKKFAWDATHTTPLIAQPPRPGTNNSTLSPNTSTKGCGPKIENSFA
ncbi:hypothetical protein EDD22DRAFT_958238 [Suillus occidentalis]|nr:hypothetical protein EDD22DRAFT_958238 [Suillus occidentalis]